MSSSTVAAVVAATGSSGTPTSFKSSQRKANLKTSRAKDVNAAATLAERTTSMEGKEKKGIKEMEYGEGQQQETIITPMVPLREITLSVSPDETAAVTSLDVNDEEDDLPSSKVTPLETTVDYSPATEPKKRKRQAEAPFQKSRKVVVKPPLSPSTVPVVPYSTGLLEDPFLKKMTSEGKDVLKDIADSKEKVENQLEELTKKLHESSSESEAFKQKQVKLLTELGKLKKAVETSTAEKRDLEQAIEKLKAKLEKTELGFSTEIQRIRSEEAVVEEEENQGLREMEARKAELERERSGSDGTTQAVEEATHRAAEASAKNEERMESLRCSLEANSVARAEEMSVLQRENESLQAMIREQQEILQSKAEADLNLLEDVRAKEKQIVTLQEQLLVYKVSADAERASVAKESERMKASIENANRRAREAEERSVMAEKKGMERTNELKELRKKAEEDNERLTHDKHALIMKVEDAERQRERLETEKQAAMAVEKYSSTAPAIQEIIPSIVSEISDAMIAVQSGVTAKNVHRRRHTEYKRTEERDRDQRSTIGQSARHSPGGWDQAVRRSLKAVGGHCRRNRTNRKRHDLSNRRQDGRKPSQCLRRCGHGKTARGSNRREYAARRLVRHKQVQIGVVPHQAKP